MVKIGKYYPLYVALFTSSTLERKQHTIKQKRGFYTFLVYLCFRRVLRAKIKGFGTFAQKIVVQQLGDIHQQGKVDALALQHLVGVGTVAMDGLSKPGHRTPLPFQLRLDHVSYVYLVSHRNCTLLNILLTCCFISCKNTTKQQFRQFFHPVRKKNGCICLIFVVRITTYLVFRKNNKNSFPVFANCRILAT